ncbi:hypothetical protein Pla175_31080 [Pirellulimonas nuda]|uniref:Protein BatD n=1 Tax=Pirellulimonas nuda TaxID=2528009 RepID=A0A518DE20_9BACT|nr:hypothetical protein [Pirellulimonas nuda]QDU89713.1 hypothetical protein Pla175_31080 [Pirellulimonas nuda]
MMFAQPMAAAVLLCLLPTAYAGAAEVGAAEGGAAEAAPQQSVVRRGPVTLRVSVDKQAAQVAEPVRLELEVRAPRGTLVELPRLPERLGAFEVRGRRLLRDLPAEGDAQGRLWVLRATLETLETGPQQVPALDAQVATGEPGATFETIRSEPIAVQITSVLEDRADPTKFRDIKDAVDLAAPSEPSGRWLVWTLAGAGVAATLALTAVLLAKRRRGPSPSAWALGQIDDLRQLPADDRAGAEMIYDELIEVVREYFELEFGTPTRARTSAELLAAAAHGAELGQTPRRRLASLVSAADDVKFARGGVGGPQLLQAFEDASAFVLECERRRAAARETSDVL